jgi:hypothetical protein
MRIPKSLCILFPIVLSLTLLTACLSDAMSLVTGQGSDNRKVSVTNEEAVKALKDALVEGIKMASGRLSKTDGYFGNPLLKIPMPPEAKPILDSISKIPQGQKLVDDVVLRINRSAEKAAAEVVPIFVDAITSMSVADGIAIVKGGDRAATGYLERKTRESLFNLFLPKVDAALGRPLAGNVSAKDAWKALITNYNRVGEPLNNAARLAKKKEPMPRVEVDLARYSTDKALDGLFICIGDEEEKIRANPLGYASDMIKKVFGALKDGLL